MAIEIVDRDEGFEEFLDLVDNIAGSNVEIGYDQASGEEDGFRLVDLASVHEFGNDNIPARPFIRGSFDNNVDELGNNGQDLLVRYLEGKADDQLTLEIWGDSYKALMQNGVITRELNLVENAPITIKRKGSDTPLIDTGRMIASADITVNKK
jgi:hypothetical protein